MTNDRRPQGPVRFSIGLISDTHCNEAEDMSASPYPANAEANPRARFAVAYLEREQPDFVIHLGDMINPVPELPTYRKSVELFHEIAGLLNRPLHLIPGNHDIGDKRVNWMPAGTIDGESIEAYSEAFGRHYYAIEHEGIRFIMLNAALINSGVAAEAEQRSFLEQEFARAPTIRTFVFIHYPLYVSDPNEPSSYDNIDEPGRSWLIRLIHKYKPEALFAAHVHNFWYDVIGDTETYVLPSTCFVRHDYSEMYRIEAGDQYGRNDVAKLGFAMLDIHDKGHCVYYRRSYAGLLGPGEKLDQAVPPLRRIHTRTSEVLNLTVDMRRSWAEEFDVAPSGAVDEFRRKRARNDYPVMALWEMGLRSMRVPLQDIIDPRVRARMELMRAAGHRFHVYCYELPDAPTAHLLARHAELIDKLEVVINWEEAEAVCAGIARLKELSGLTICLSRVNRKDASKFSGKQYNHLISHGFSLEELSEVSTTLKRIPGGEAVANVMVSIPRQTCPWTAAVEANLKAQATGLALSLYIRSTSASPAEAFVNDEDNAERFLTAAFAAIAHPDIDVIIDAFTDADRGYFVRTGLVDLRYNPRRASELLSEFMARIHQEEAWQANPNGKPAHLISLTGAQLSLRRTSSGGTELSA